MKKLSKIVKQGRDAHSAAMRYREIVASALDALQCFDSDDRLAQLFWDGLVRQLGEVDQDYKPTKEEFQKFFREAHDGKRHRQD